MCDFPKLKFEYAKKLITEHTQSNLNALCCQQAAGGQNEEKLATGPHEIRPGKSVQEAAAFRDGERETNTHVLLSLLWVSGQTGGLHSARLS